MVFSVFSDYGVFAKQEKGAKKSFDRTQENHCHHNILYEQVM